MEKPRILLLATRKTIRLPDALALQILMLAVGAIVKMPPPAIVWTLCVVAAYWCLRALVKRWADAGMPRSRSIRGIAMIARDSGLTVPALCLLLAIAFPILPPGVWAIRLLWSTGWYEEPPFNRVYSIRESDDGRQILELKTDVVPIDMFLVGIYPGASTKIGDDSYLSLSGCVDSLSYAFDAWGFTFIQASSNTQAAYVVGKSIGPEISLCVPIAGGFEGFWVQTLTDKKINKCVADASCTSKAGTSDRTYLPIPQAPPGSTPAPPTPKRPRALS